MLRDYLNAVFLAFCYVILIVIAIHACGSAQSLEPEEEYPGVLRTARKPSGKRRELMGGVTATMTRKP
ncbi:hypothetical protein NDU88_002510 [Pleurodeles waltl]|uniref:Uncharacterized protein n=1 Tax=Pleurodeles waltl TaxID=8319 RepID=A0AAV7LG08_PLEWA|nr:hypothetical protein NDU88_002510 [Pleurodeles waltl]